MAQGIIKSEETRNHMTGLLWTNMGNLEGDMQSLQGDMTDLQEDVAEALQEIDNGVPELEAAKAAFYAELMAAGMKKLNGPNLIANKQDFFTTRNIPTSDVIEETLTVPAETAEEAAVALTYTITNENITSSYVLHDKKTGDYEVVAYGSITGTFSAGSATITIAARSGAHNAAVTVKVYLCTVTSTTVPYGRSWKTYATGKAWVTNIANSGITYPGDDDDEVKEAYAALSGNNVVTDEDGETYNKAIAFMITNPPSNGWGNCDWLIFLQGSSTYGQINAMEDGHVYTMSCWARITSGTNACLRLAYGFDDYGNTPVSPDRENNPVESSYKEISGSGWQRVYWTFTYHAQIVGSSWTRTNYKRIGFGVCRKYAGTVQLCGFRLTEGELYQPDASKLITDKADKANPAFTGTITLGNTTMTEVQLAALLALESANGQSF